MLASLCFGGGLSALGSEAFAACTVELLPTTLLSGLEYLVILSKLTPVLPALRNKNIAFMNL